MQTSALVAMGLLLLVAACDRAKSVPEEAPEVASSDGLVGLESAISDSSVGDVGTVEPAARTSGDEAAAAVDPLASAYPETSIDAMASANQLEVQQKEGEKK